MLKVERAGPGPGTSSAEPADGSPGVRTPVSIIIPAHDEETTIGLGLEALLADAEPGELEVIVACNGCHDRTADVARSYGPDVLVLELDVASKYEALRAGDARASRFPRCYVDADVVVDTAAIRAVASALEAGPASLASPRLRLDLSGRPWYVRAYFRFWLQTPYARAGVAGTGFYGLSERGRGRFDRFPDVMADDQYILTLFGDDERRSVETAEVTVQAPRTLPDLIRIKTRSYTGNRELQSRFGRSEAGPSGRSTLLQTIRRRPSLLPAAPLYVAICLIADYRSRRQAARRDFTTWERDRSTRPTAPGPVRPPAGRPGSDPVERPTGDA